MTTGLPGYENAPRRSPRSAVAPHSSSVSRNAASSRVSPRSTCPPGNVQRPRPGSIARLTRRTRSPRTMRTPAAIFGSIQCTAPQLTQTGTFLAEVPTGCSSSRAAHCVQKIGASYKASGYRVSKEASGGAGCLGTTPRPHFGRLLDAGERREENSPFAPNTFGTGAQREAPPNDPQEVDRRRRPLAESELRPDGPADAFQGARAAARGPGKEDPADEARRGRAPPATKGAGFAQGGREGDFGGAQGIREGHRALPQAAFRRGRSALRGPHRKAPRREGIPRPRAHVSRRLPHRKEDEGSHGGRAGGAVPRSRVRKESRQRREGARAAPQEPGPPRRRWPRALPHGLLPGAPG